MNPKAAIFTLVFILSVCVSITSQTPVIQPSTTTPLPPAPVETSTLPAPSAQPPAAAVLVSTANAGQLEEIGSIPLENVNQLAWIPETDILVVTAGNQIKLINVTSMKVQQDLTMPENYSLLDFNPASRLIALSKDRLTLSIRDLSDNEVATVQPPGGFGSASFNNSGSLVWISSMEEFKTTAYDFHSGKEVTTCGGFETAAPVYTVFPSPGGKWLVWMARATVQLTNPTDCAAVSRIGHEDFVISHAFNRDETILATSTGGTINDQFFPLIYFWDTTTGLPAGNIILKETPARGLSFSSDGSLIASAGAGLFIWDVITGQEIKMLGPADKQFTSVVFSPDGTILAAAAEKNLHFFSIKS